MLVLKIHLVLVMLKKKFFRSLIKKILPSIFKLLIKFRSNRRVINFLNEKSYDSNEVYDFSSIIRDLIKNDKINSSALVGST